MDLPCVICGTMMYNVRRDRKYCCRKCQNEGQRRAKESGTFEKICEKCGKSFTPLKYGGTRRYCFECVPEISTKGSEERKRIKEWAVEYKGGKCELCGYDKCNAALDFHHKNPAEKDFILSDRNLILSWKEIQQELDKCMLLCANCHRELHAKEGKE